MVLEWIKKNISVVVIVLGLIVLIVLVAWPKTLPPSGAEAVNEVRIALEKQYLDQIADYKNKLSASEINYKRLVDKYVDLERRKIDVKPPTTDAELRDRFIALGYPPLPAVK